MRGGGRGRTAVLFCIAAVLLSRFVCLWQLLPVKEIDGTTSQDIFTILNIGEHTLGLIPRLHGSNYVVWE